MDQTFNHAVQVEDLQPEVRRLTEEIQKMAKAKKTSDAKHTSLQREHEATMLVLERTFVRLADVRAELQEAKDSLHVENLEAPQEMPLGRGEKAKRPREEEDRRAHV